MKNTLNQILRKLMRHSGVIGTVYTGTKLVGTVPNNIETEISNVMLPAGTYVVTGFATWNISDPSKTVYSLQANRSLFATARGDMVNGGGDCLSGVLSVSEAVKLSICAIQTRGANTELDKVTLRAVRIK